MQKHNYATAPFSYALHGFLDCEEKIWYYFVIFKGVLKWRNYTSLSMEAGSIRYVVLRGYWPVMRFTTVVAMLVKYAITHQGDYFAILAGDADILPAINIAYPEFTNNVCLVTTHPDEMDHSPESVKFRQKSMAISAALCYTYAVSAVGAIYRKVHFFILVFVGEIL